MFQSLITEEAETLSFLCLRRGVSEFGDRLSLVKIFSLPTQRCFPRCAPRKIYASLFSAYAEVFLHPSATSEHHAPFLCLRRGVSTPPDRDDLGPQLFSAYAEVFPRFVSPVFLIIPFLCLRRGVSQHRFPWGCDQQLFSAYAEVFPLRKSEICSTVAFLCLRRGVSPPSSLAVLRLWLFSAYAEVFPLSVRGFKEVYVFSLPTQRCF